MDTHKKHKPKRWRWVFIPTILVTVLWVLFGGSDAEARKAIPEYDKECYEAAALDLQQQSQPDKKDKVSEIREGMEYKVAVQLVSMLSDKDITDATAGSVCRSLKEMCRDAVSLALADGIRSENGERPLCIMVNLLAENGVNSYESCSAVKAHINSPSEAVRSAAVDALMKMHCMANADDIESLLLCLSKYPDDKKLRAYISSMLSELGAHEFNSLLSELEKRRNRWDESVPRHVAVVSVILDAIGAVGARCKGPDVDRAVDCLTRIAVEKSSTRLNAIDALRRIGPASVKALPCLSKFALSSESLEIRISSINAIASIGPEAKPALPVLSVLVEDNNAENGCYIVMVYAANAILAIEPENKRAFSLLMSSLAAGNEAENSYTKSTLIRIGMPVEKRLRAELSRLSVDGKGQGKLAGELASVLKAIDDAEKKRCFQEAVDSNGQQKTENEEPNKPKPLPLMKRIESPP